MFDSDARKDDQQFTDWAKEVKRRDNYTCVLCGKHGGFLHAHHLNSWDAFPDERYLLPNGRTLCNICHDTFHRNFGFGQNTEMQFAEFKIIYKIFRNIIINRKER